MRYPALATTALMLSGFTPFHEGIARPGFLGSATVLAMGPVSAPQKPGGAAESTSSNCSSAPNTCAGAGTKDPHKRR
jgi:hypothetical protein